MDDSDPPECGSDRPPLPSTLSSTSPSALSGGDQADEGPISVYALENSTKPAVVDQSIFSNATFIALADARTEFQRWRPVSTANYNNNNVDGALKNDPRLQYDLKLLSTPSTVTVDCLNEPCVTNNTNFGQNMTIDDHVSEPVSETVDNPFAIPFLRPIVRFRMMAPPPSFVDPRISLDGHYDTTSSVTRSLRQCFNPHRDMIHRTFPRFVHPAVMANTLISYRPRLGQVFYNPHSVPVIRNRSTGLPPAFRQRLAFHSAKRPYFLTFGIPPGRPFSPRFSEPITCPAKSPPSCSQKSTSSSTAAPQHQALASTQATIFKARNNSLKVPDPAAPVVAMPSPLNGKRFCQTKIMELWHLLSGNVDKARRTFYGDLWLPPDEEAFTIDCAPGDPVKTLLALRTPVWPPVVSKILLICVKKVPCGKDDNCLRRLRDHTRWMRNDLQNHVASYKSFRQLKSSDDIDYWYLQRHSCEFNLVRFVNSTFHSKAVAELLIKDFFHGLDYLHNQGQQYLFHGGLKPSNVLIDLQADGRLSLILVDFGFGRLRCPKVGILHEIKCLTANGRHLNELCWKPPEFFDSTDHKSFVLTRCASTVTMMSTSSSSAPPFSSTSSSSSWSHCRYGSASDAYSAGLLVYFLLTKRHPFAINFQTTMMHLKSFMQEERYSLDGVEDEIRCILRQLLSSEVRRRPAVGQLLDEPLCWNSERRLKFLLDVAADRDLYLRPDAMSGRNNGRLMRADLRADAGQAGRLIALDLSPALLNKVEFLIGERFYPSIINILLALKFYIEEKQAAAKTLTTASLSSANSWNSDTASSSQIFSPKDEYKFWVRYAAIFWDVLRIIKNHREYLKLVKVQFYNDSGKFSSF